MALFTYADRLQTVMDFTETPTAWKKAFENLAAPTFSEANFYDAAIEVLNRLDTMAGRKALIVITTGIDTFSQATFDDVVKRAGQ